MSVDAVTGQTQFAGGRGAHGLQFEGGGAFADRLRIGEVLQGKVMRHFDGSRYAVNFGGTEKIVDSALPLTSGELIHGRVVGLGDKVQLQRVYPDGARQGTPADSPSTEARSGHQALLQDLLNRYQVEMKAVDQAQVIGLMKGHARPSLLAMSALLANKLGLEPMPVLVRALSRTLAGEAQSLDKVQHAPVAVLASDGESVARPDTNLIRELAALLALQTEPPLARSADETAAEAGSGPGMSGDAQAGGDDSAGQQRDPGDSLARWVLNAQGQGSVDHRLLSFPVWLGERLVEVDVALFSQRQATVRDDSVRHRKIVFSLSTRDMGTIEISVFAAERRLRLHFSSERPDTSEVLTSHLSDIKHTLGLLGWQVDEVSYAVAEQVSDGVLRSVVNHHITRDSLSRVM